MSSDLGNKRIVVRQLLTETGYTFDEVRRLYTNKTMTPLAYAMGLAKVMSFAELWGLSEEILDLLINRLKSYSIIRKMEQRALGLPESP